MTLVRPAVKGTPTEMPFGMWAHVTMYYMGVWIPMERGNLGAGRGSLLSNYFDLLF